MAERAAGSGLTGPGRQRRPMIPSEQLFRGGQGAGLTQLVPTIEVPSPWKSAPFPCQIRIRTRTAQQRARLEPKPDEGSHVVL